MANKKRRWPIGPGLLVAAAFIGPGTVTAASKAGASFGYALIWAVLFSVVATIVLQEMAVRLGLIAQQGLGEAIRGQFPGAFSRFIACGLVVFAIGFGNSAYQTGNLTGAAQGLDLLTGWEATWWIWLLGLVAFVVLWLGGHGWLERGLIVLVL
ncbi:MAG: divalent metal cation transporter [Pirellulaceae bacterium]